MQQHPNESGETPQQAHDRLKATISPEDYDLINRRAAAAAAHIKSIVGSHGKVHQVQWTSKPGDLHRATGIQASQQEDPSDIVVTTKNGRGQVRHHGVSLKVTDKSSGEVPVSNPGLESTYGGGDILNSHRAYLQKKYSKMAGMNKPQRKAFLQSNTGMQNDLQKRNKKVLTDIVDNMHARLTAMTPQQRAEHIRKYVLHAHQTPMQKQGHAHIKHTTFGTDNFSFGTADPGQDYEHILRDPKNIGVQKRGTSVIFTHKGEPFARHRIKFESQSDPLSSIKGSGELM